MNVSWNLEALLFPCRPQVKHYVFFPFLFLERLNIAVGNHLSDVSG